MSQSFSLFLIGTGLVGSVTSVGIFSYLLNKNQNARNTKIVYWFVLILHCWVSTIYALTLIGIFSMGRYGEFIRPLIMLINILPASIALLHRR